MSTPTHVEIEVDIAIITKPISLKKLKLIVILSKTIKNEIKNGVLVSCLAKKKFGKTLINEKAGTP